PYSTPVIDFTQLAGNFDSTEIPSMDQHHVPGTKRIPSASATSLSPEFAAILAQLTHNQTMLQNSLIDVMNEVAHQPANPIPDQNPVPHGSHIKNAEFKLNALKQTVSAQYYLTAFMKLASHLEMTEQTKITRFMKGLKSSVKDHLVNIVNCPTTLEDWKPLVISIDTNLHQCKIKKRIESGKKSKNTSSPQSNTSYQHTPSSSTTSSNNSSSTPDVVPMDVNALTTGSKPRGPLTPAEHKHRIKNNLCLYCGKEGYKAMDCNKCKAKHGDSGKAKPKTN
ncbi:hypothetical protein C0992_000905, partial [Termitomyces sp. T32_za158]